MEKEKGISKTIYSDFVVGCRGGMGGGGKGRRKGKSGEDEGQPVNHFCRFSISALNASPCQNVMM